MPRPMIVSVGNRGPWRVQRFFLRNKSILDQSWRSLENGTLMRSGGAMRSLMPDKMRIVDSGARGQKKMHGLWA